MTTLPTLGQGDRLIGDGGRPTLRLQAAWEEIVAAIGRKQASDDDLAALAALAATGLVARTAAGTFATRTLTGPAAGISVTNGGGVAGNPTIALANDLAGLEGLAGSGLARRTGTDTWATLEYDAGTFTPVISFGGSSAGIVYTNQVGRVIRVGSLVSAHLRITLSSNGSGVGNVLISGLPFSQASPPPNGVCSVVANLASVPRGLVIGTTIVLYNATGALSQLTDSDVGNAADLRISVSYPV